MRPSPPPRAALLSRGSSDPGSFVDDWTPSPPPRAALLSRGSSDPGSFVDDWTPSPPPRSAAIALPASRSSTRRWPPASPNLLASDGDPPSLSLGCEHSTPSPRAASVSLGFDCSSVVDDRDDVAAAAGCRRQHLAQHLALQCQDVVSRFERGLFSLAYARNEAAELRRENDDLRRENDDLRVANEDLACRIRMVGGELPDEFSGLHRAEEHTMPPLPPRLPKSLNVRSPGYDYMNLHGKHPSSKATKLGSQRMFLGMDGGVKRVGEDWDEEEPNDGSPAVEVHNQGMLKTELCHMWQQNRACPYGDRCKFAHGMGELRTVIRHPRYKTNVCRMVLAGAVCPYGHRCHFRHCITPTDLA